MILAVLGAERDCVGKAQQQLSTTDQSSRQEGRPTLTNPQLSDSSRNMVMGPRWVPDTKTDWPTDRTSRIFRLLGTQGKLSVLVRV
jgi:hypothetical protein